MSKFKRVPLFSALTIGILALVILSGCTPQYASSTSDEHVCVFDGSERGGKKLKFQVAPGSESKEIDDNDVVVRIPSSNRFYTAAKNDNTRDPKAPSFYEGSAQGSVPVQIEGQVRFKFNLKLACEWFSKHGRRNANDGDLAFNARGTDAETSGWLIWLAENFAQTLQQTIRPLTNSYDWAALHYDYPSNAGEDGRVPEGDEAAKPTTVKLAGEISEAFTASLKSKLGGNYFCGITGKGDCPPLDFEVIRATGPEELVTQRTQFENTQEALEQQELEAELQEEQQDALLRAEQNKQVLLEEQIRTAEAQALLDTAKCRAIVAVNPALDCEGKHPAVIVGGNG